MPNSNTLVVLGRTLGSPTGLNHYLDDFIYITKGMDEEVALAIQENRFTKEMADSILNKTATEEAITGLTLEGLLERGKVGFGLVRTLNYFGLHNRGEEDLEYAEQRRLMKSNEKSYRLILNTFRKYANFIKGAIYKLQTLSAQNPL